LQSEIQYFRSNEEKIGYIRKTIYVIGNSSY